MKPSTVLTSIFFSFLLNTAEARFSYAKAVSTAVVYVETNLAAPDGNSVLAYSRDAAGGLTPVPGSPFPTGGAGVGDAAPAASQFDSDQNVIVSADGSRLFAVNSGSNSIAVFDIAADGSLVAVSGSPFPSGGLNPVSVGLAGNNLYVVHQGVDALAEVLPNYTGFVVASDGALTPIPGSTVEVPAGSGPTQALPSPANNLLFGADFRSQVLQVFGILGDGRLLQAPPLGPAEETSPLGLQIHPFQPILYVGFVSIGRLGVYTYDDAGNLTFLRSVPNSGRAICWLAVNRGGTCLYSSNTGDNSISAYDLSDPTTPIELERIPLRGGGGPFQSALDPAGAFLHVVSQRFSETPPGDGNLLHVLQVDPAACTLSEVPSSPLQLPVSDNTRPQGVAIR